MSFTAQIGEPDNRVEGRWCWDEVTQDIDCNPDVVDHYEWIADVYTPIWKINGCENPITLELFDCIVGYSHRELEFKSTAPMPITVCDVLRFENLPELNIGELAVFPGRMIAIDHAGNKSAGFCNE